MREAEDPVGPDNDKLLRQMLPQVGMVVCAWGTDGVYQGRVEQVLRMLDVRGQALVVTRDGLYGSSGETGQNAATDSEKTKIKEWGFRVVPSR